MDLTATCFTFLDFCSWKTPPLRYSTLDLFEVRKTRCRVVNDFWIGWLRLTLKCWLRRSLELHLIWPLWLLQQCLQRVSLLLQLSGVPCDDTRTWTCKWFYPNFGSGLVFDRQVYLSEFRSELTLQTISGEAVLIHYKRVWTTVHKAFLLVG